MFFWKISTSKFSNHDIANFVKKKNFDDKLKKIYRNVIANKTKHLLVEKLPKKSKRTYKRFDKWI